MTRPRRQPPKPSLSTASSPSTPTMPESCWCKRGRIETPAATRSVVDIAHQLQGKFDEGPCLDAVKGGEDIYLVTNAAADPRWPKWGPAAADLGYFSVIGASLETHSQRIGSLNLYAHRPDAFTNDEVETVKWLATHASVAMAAAKEHTSARKAPCNARGACSLLEQEQLPDLNGQRRLGFPALLAFTANPALGG